MTYREVTEALVSLQQDVLCRYHKLGYPGFDPLLGNVRFSDVRIWVLSVGSMDIGLVGALLNAMANAKEHPEQEYYIRALFGLANAEVPLDYVLDRLSQYLRLAFTTMWQFRIDLFVTKILEKFDAKKAAKGYTQKVAYLLTILEIKDSEKTVKTLRVLGFIRNSLHANGVHNRGGELKHTLGDCEFNFQPRKEVLCAEWQHILVAVKATIEIIEEIITSTKVAAIKDTISDTYVEGDQEE